MEFSIFNSICELSVDNALNKFIMGSDSINLTDTKKCLYYIYGKKFKKKEILSCISLEKDNCNSNCNCNCNLLSREQFKLLCIKVRNTSDNMTLAISNHDMILSVFSFLKQQEENSIQINSFKKTFKQLIPNLNDQLVNEIFLYLDRDQDGCVKLSDLEQMLLN